VGPDCVWVLQARAISRIQLTLNQKSRTRHDYTIYHLQSEYRVLPRLAAAPRGNGLHISFNGERMHASIRLRKDTVTTPSSQQWLKRAAHVGKGGGKRGYQTGACPRLECALHAEIVCLCPALRACLTSLMHAIHRKGTEDAEVD